MNVAMNAAMNVPITPRSGPQRIVCLTEETTEWLYLLGEEDRIVGISGYTVRPRRARQEKPRVSSFLDGKIEKIVALQPDLVIGFSDMQAALADQLIRAGLNVFITNQRSVAQVFATLRLVAGLVGAQDRAEAWIAACQARHAKIADVAAGWPRRPRVYFEEWDEPMISAIQWVSELITVAGGDDVFPERALLGLGRDRVLADALEPARRAPDVIFGSWCGKKFRPEKLAARSGWADVPAVREGRLHEIKSCDILQPGPAALTDGLEQLHAHCLAWALARRDRADSAHVLEVNAMIDIQDPVLAARVQHRIDHLTKPLGALGRIEALALQMALVLGLPAPRLLQPQLVVFAADHGIAAQGVSAFPQAVTVQMVANMLAGGAAVSVLARQHGLALTVVDCGVATEMPAQTGLHVAKVGAGTADSSTGPAMSTADCAAALQHGRALLHGLPGNALLLGEMGIANTSAAALLMARLTGLPLTACVGRGTGLDDAGLVHKQSVLQRALDLHATATGPLDVLAALGGLEIATMVGAVLQAAEERRLIVVDGFITTAAVAVAAALQPAVLQRCVFAHGSAENGHARWLMQLGVQPLLNLGLRLGEGSGAALAWPLLKSAELLLAEMASFEAAGVSNRDPDSARAG